MRTRVELVAVSGQGGTTRLLTNRAEGILNARRTGPDEVHLVGTGAGPLGGDTVEVDVVVEPGARLLLRGVAATLSMPDRSGRPARIDLRLRVAEGGHLDVALEPLVAVRGSDLHAVTTATVDEGGALDLTEVTVLGRWREAPGSWRGTLRADLAGAPWLRQSVALGPGSPTWDALDAPRVLVSRLRSPAALATTTSTTLSTTTTTKPAGRTVGCAAALPLAGGGELAQALGHDLLAARRDLAALEPEPARFRPTETSGTLTG
ncbi:urease accessory protein [Quadrisphaera granulorum]|uniref:Urease accessory protein UreD n=1 Tax=Quadrisphaera granulorum TaxID=317664 RepID=A0A316A5E4_9ACTN|nr:urease accessory protein UreD [Quadrisphaera granulorum]PWJ52915.1 urease accessory protein [Quadrisphaera granulorum]SZE97297.1 urease accessory protein [Quadrisphaera granulorum]